MQRRMTQFFPAIRMGASRKYCISFSPLISGALLIGIVSGSVLGVYSEFAPAFFGLTTVQDLFRTSSSFGKQFAFVSSFSFIALLCSSSTLGCVLLPGASFLLGLKLSCEVAYGFCLNQCRALICVLCSQALPIFLRIVSFLLISCCGIRFSLSFFPAQESSRFRFSRLSMLTAVFISLLLLFISALYLNYIMPIAVRRFLQ